MVSMMLATSCNNSASCSDVDGCLYRGVLERLEEACRECVTSRVVGNCVINLGGNGVAVVFGAFFRQRGFGVGIEVISRSIIEIESGEVDYLLIGSR
jgi:hypothetical protein